MYFTFPYTKIHSGGLGSVLHSYGRLIPHQFPITDLKQISGADGLGRINCTVGKGKAWFRPDRYLQTRELTQRRNGAMATLVVNPRSSFENGDIYCSWLVNEFYLFISGNSEFNVHTTLRLTSCMYMQSLHGLSLPNMVCIYFLYIHSACMHGTGYVEHCK